MPIGFARYDLALGGGETSDPENPDGGTGGGGTPIPGGARTGFEIDASFDPATDLTSTQKLWYDRASAVIPGHHNNELITDAIRRVSQGGLGKQPTYIIARGGGRELHARCSLLLRKVGAAEHLDAAVEVLNAMKDRLLTDSNNGVTFKTFGVRPVPAYKNTGETDMNPHDDVFASAAIAVAMRALWVNRTATSPAGHNYRDEANYWYTYLTRDYLDKWFSGEPWRGNNHSNWSSTERSTRRADKDYPDAGFVQGGLVLPNWRRGRHPTIANSVLAYHMGRVMEDKNHPNAGEWVQLGIDIMRKEYNARVVGPDGYFYWNFIPPGQDYLIPSTYAGYWPNWWNEWWEEGYLTTAQFTKVLGYVRRVLRLTPSGGGSGYHLSSSAYSGNSSRVGAYSIGGENYTVPYHGGYAGIPSTYQVNSQYGHPEDDIAQGTLKQHCGWPIAGAFHDDVYEISKDIYVNLFPGAQADGGDSSPDHNRIASAIFAAAYHRGD